MRSFHHGVRQVHVLPMRSFMSAGWLTLVLSAFCFAQTPTMEWIRQFGTPQTNDAGLDGDGITGISLDGLGNLFVGGTTWGNLFGPNGGNQDLFLAKFDLAGNYQWGRQYSAPSQQRGGCPAKRASISRSLIRTLASVMD